MGATLNRCVNILIIFRFIISSVIADFWADRNLRRIGKAFSFRFKRLQDELVRGHQGRVSLGTALQYRMNPCSTAVQPQDHIPLSRSQIVPVDPQSRTQSNALRSPLLVLDKCNRSFGDDQVTNLASCGAQGSGDHLCRTKLRLRRSLRLGSTPVSASNASKTR